MLQKLFNSYPERSWYYSYNAQGLVAEVDGPRSDVNDISRFEYNAQGQRSAVMNALGHRSDILAFNAQGLPTQLRDANGLITELSYNSRGWLTRKTLKTDLCSKCHFNNKQNIHVSNFDSIPEIDLVAVVRCKRCGDFTVIIEGEPLAVEALTAMIADDHEFYHLVGFEKL